MSDRLIDKMTCDSDYGDGGVYFYEEHFEWRARHNDSNSFIVKYKNIVDMTTSLTHKKKITILTNAGNKWNLYLYKYEEFLAIVRKQMQLCKQKADAERQQQTAAAAAAAAAATASQFANQSPRNDQYFNGAPNVNSAEMNKLRNKIEELENIIDDLKSSQKQLQKQINYLAEELEGVQKRLPLNVGGNEQIPSVKQVDDLREKIGHLEWRVLTLERK